jgi:hypothetical protein
MALSNFLSKLNWRLILIHLCACWFFIYSFQVLVYLHDYNFVSIILKYPKNPEKWPFDAHRFYNDILWLGLSKYIGLLTGFLISLAICIKRHWFWLNSLIVFLVAFLLSRFYLFGWRYLKHIFLAPGSLFKENSFRYFLVNGLIMLIIGLVLFFLSYWAKFMTGNRKANNEPVAPSAT